MEIKPDHYFPSIDSTKNRIVSSHLPYMSLPKAVKDSSASKLIYVCRNPKDAFVSLWHFTNKLRPPQVGSLSLEEAVEMFCKGVSVAGPFWDHVLQYWQESLKNPDKVLVLKYEDLRDEPNSHVKRIAEFMGCPFSKEEEASGIVNEIINFCSFEKLSNFEVNKHGKDRSGLEYKNFFRCAMAEDWKNYLTPDMADRIDLLTIKKFQGFGLKLLRIQRFISFLHFEDEL
ncbi:hypothetical protein ACH5RR_041161 [Cinchona calisaya]|uniref:Sulfotransferase n=1 Tax=Cinchona calisaya TaxID=153742 RepID=A0ABD2XVZ6_9GENT